MPDSKPVVGNAYGVLVDYGKSVEELVKSGRYHWSNSDITSKHFPTKRIGKTEIAVELVHFNRYIGIDEALKEFERMGCRPAELHELLVLGVTYPDFQREFPIIAISSVWQDSNGYRRVPCLSKYGSERTLRLSRIEDGWGEISRFAAVRK